ncbi:MAG: hypothetical protein QG594_1728 [Bacteroidota bacterium]|nr:hypothetical protein [Bacteroidota bacterium]
MTETCLWTNKNGIATNDCEWNCSSVRNEKSDEGDGSCNGSSGGGSSNGGSGGGTSSGNIYSYLLNTLINKHFLYKTISQRNDYYAWANTQMTSLGIKWFEAADMLLLIEKQMKDLKYQLMFGL